MLRELAEWRRAHEAVAAARPGDLVLVDGSLHPGLFLPAGLVEPVHELARERGVDLVATSRRPSSAGAATPRWSCGCGAGPRASSAPDACWYLRVTGPEEAPEVYVANLARAGAYASGSTPSVGTATPAGCSPSWPGWVGRPGVPRLPLPAGRRPPGGVAARPLLADLRRDLREAFLREGLSEDDIDLVMRDYHLTLNA